jgi:hypothetical protein
MPRTQSLDPEVVEIWRRQRDLITRAQALAAGISEASLRRRLAPAGPWSVVLPGVYLVHVGGLTVSQRELAAILYSGQRGVITGLAALGRLGVKVPLRDTVDVLVPHDRQRRSISFVRVHRTRRMPDKTWRMDDLYWAPPARAVADAVRRQDVSFARALVAAAVQQRKCTVRQLAVELRDGPTQGSGPLRAALAEVADGIASIAEGDLRQLIVRGKLPAPMYNPKLYVGDTFLASPDAWWPDAGVACEVDSREWHLSPADWERTQQRHARMSKCGIIVQHFSPRRIRSEPAKVLDELAGAIESGRQRPPLAISAVAVG